MTWCRLSEIFVFHSPKAAARECSEVMVKITVTAPKMPLKSCFAEVAAQLLGILRNERAHSSFHGQN